MKKKLGICPTDDVEFVRLQLARLELLPAHFQNTVHLAIRILVREPVTTQRWLRRRWSANDNFKELINISEMRIKKLE